MIERPISFNCEMMSALLYGSKTQTRRIAKFQMRDDNMDHPYICPYGQRGDLLWVREPFAYVNCIDYDAIYSNGDIEMHWTPAEYMPREYSRVLLKITNVRLDRLHSISNADCIAEGAPGGHGSIPGYPYNATPVEHYRHIWISIYGAKVWNANPLVWVIEFRRPSDKEITRIRKIK